MNITISMSGGVQGDVEIQLEGPYHSPYDVKLNKVHVEAMIDEAVRRLKLAYEIGTDEH